MTITVLVTVSATLSLVNLIGVMEGKYDLSNSNRNENVKIYGRKNKDIVIDG